MWEEVQEKNLVVVIDVIGIGVQRQRAPIKDDMQRKEALTISDSVLELQIIQWPATS